MTYEGIEFVIRTGLSRNEWAVSIEFPNASDALAGASVVKVTGTRDDEPPRVCRRLHVWMPRVMQAVFERFRHAIGCGHVSGLKLRREPYRGPSWRYADQVQINSTSS